MSVGKELQEVARLELAGHLGNLVGHLGVLAQVFGESSHVMLKDAQLE